MASITQEGGTDSCGDVEWREAGWLLGGLGVGNPCTSTILCVSPFAVKQRLTRHMWQPHHKTGKTDLDHITSSEVTLVSVVLRSKHAPPEQSPGGARGAHVYLHILQAGQAGGGGVQHGPRGNVCACTPGHGLAGGLVRSSSAVVAQPPHVFAQVMVTFMQTDGQAGCIQGEHGEREWKIYRQADRVKLRRHKPAQGIRQTCRRITQGTGRCCSVHL